jgi:hypothetical protein
MRRYHSKLKVFHLADEFICSVQKYALTVLRHPKPGA